jgi:hypothetical protein
MPFPVVAAMLLIYLCVSSRFRALSAGAMGLRRATKILYGELQLNVYGKKVRDIISCINQRNEANAASCHSYKVSWCL